MKIQIFFCIFIILQQIFSLSRADSPVFAKHVNSKNKNLNSELKNKQQSIIKKIYSIDSYADLAMFGVDIDTENRQSFQNLEIKGRAGTLNIPAALRIKDDSKEATPGKCDPKPVCITNPLTLNMTESNQIAFPPCINIHRCDGCCPNNEKCVAIKTKEVKLSRVGIINFNDAEKPVYKESFVTVQNHTECECKCQWDSNEDCKLVNANFIKDPDSCDCMCPEQLTCDAFHEFNRESCECICKQDKYYKIENTCKQRGFHWNNILCRCEVYKSQS